MINFTSMKTEGNPAIITIGYLFLKKKSHAELAVYGVIIMECNFISLVFINLDTKLEKNSL